MTSILNDPVYFIFPILTSMSFYGKPRTLTLDNNDKERNEEVININTGTENVNAESGNEPSRQMNFSVRQSNILYILFIFGFILCIGADVLHQSTRKNTKLLNGNIITFILFQGQLPIYFHLSDSDHLLSKLHPVGRLYPCG